MTGGQEWGITRWSSVSQPLIPVILTPGHCGVKNRVLPGSWSFLPICQMLPYHGLCPPGPMPHTAHPVSLSLHLTMISGVNLIFLEGIALESSHLDRSHLLSSSWEIVLLPFNVLVEVADLSGLLSANFMLQFKSLLASDRATNESHRL